MVNRPVIGMNDERGGVSFFSIWEWGGFADYSRKGLRGVARKNKGSRYGVFERDVRKIVVICSYKNRYIHSQRQCYACLPLTP